MSETPVAYPTHAELLSFLSRPYTADERAEIRVALNGAGAPALARLHVRLAEWASEAVQGVLEQGRVLASELALYVFF